MAEAAVEEEEATAAVEAGVAAEGMIATAGRTEIADQHQLKKVKKSMSP